MNNNNLVVVYWKNQVTGEGGHGMPIDREIAEDWIDEMRGKYPQIVHWTEAIETAKESEPAKT